MKQSPELSRIQADMRPGVITRDGFLGPDRRTLSEILSDDDAEVRRLGVTHAGIAARMRELREAGSRGLGLTVSVPPHFEVLVDAVRGKLACPFHHAGLIDKLNISIRNLRSDTELSYTELDIHLIEQHGFYQGHGSSYRLDPRRIVEVLEVPTAREDPSAVTS